MNKTMKTGLFSAVLLLLASLIFCAMAYRNTSMINEVSVHSLKTPFSISANIGNMMTEITEMRVMLDHFSEYIASDGLERFEANLDQKHERVEQYLAAVGAEYPGPQEDIERLSAIISDSKRVQRHILAQVWQSQNPEFVGKLIGEQLRPLRQALHESVATVLAFPEEEISEKLAEADRNVWLSLVYSGGFLIIIVSVLAWTMLTLFRQSREIHHRSELFTQLSKNINHVFLIYDVKKGRCEMTSLNTERVLGIPRAVFERETHPLRAYMNLEEAKKLEAMVFEARVGEQVEHECTITDERGNERWIKVSAYIIPNGGENATYRIIVLSDLTESRNSFLDLQDALHLAQQAGEAKQNFLSRMSHEIRTPMNAIIGMATIAASAPDNVSKVEHCLEKILLSSKHLLMLINDVLDMSKIDAGNLQIASEPFELPQVIDQINTLIFHQAEQKKLHYEAILKNVTEENLVGDPLRLKQILINLLSNAVKFTPENGRVTMEIQQLFVKDSKVRLRFTVSDTGIGMNEAFLERIFDPFEQAQGSDQQFGGTGLGLCITKNLVTLCDGFINVKSKPGQGSTFTVELDFGLSAPKPKTNNKKLPDLHVLVVDDDQGCCEHAALILKNIGVRGSWVLSGEEGVALVAAGIENGDQFDVCFVDWKMPNMDGLETTRRIRELVGAETLIIIISAYDWEEIEDEARKAGADAFVSKPLFQSTIYDTLLNVTGNWKDNEAGSSGLLMEGQPDFSDKRILLVEDNLINSEIAQEMLSQTGADVECAEDGEVALGKFRQSGPGYYDLILMDVQMPRMDGYACSRAIRSSEHPDATIVPIVAMTANAFSEDVSEALASGMDDHVAKPIDLQIFYSTLSRFLDEAGQS